LRGKYYAECPEDAEGAERRKQNLGFVGLLGEVV